VRAQLVFEQHQQLAVAVHVGGRPKAAMLEGNTRSSSALPSLR
jgi:hypothetical protein